MYDSISVIGDSEYMYVHVYQILYTCNIICLSSKQN